MIDQKLNEAAGWILGWKPEQRCAWCKDGQRYFTQVGDSIPTGIRHEPHDLSAPDFNDWRVAGAALEKYILNESQDLTDAWNKIQDLSVGTGNIKTAIAIACAKLGEQQ